MEFGLDTSVEYQVMRRLHGGREQLDISADKPWCREIAILSRGVKETKDALKLRHATASSLGRKRRPASSQAQFKSMRTKVTWGRIWALVWSASLMLDRGKAAISATPAASRVGKKALLV